MRGLVRHHGVIRSLPKTAAAAMATATLGLNVLVFKSLQSGSVMGVGRTGLFQLLILLAGLYILLQNDTGRRSTRWFQSLPVTSRTLWTAHIRSLVVAVSQSGTTTDTNRTVDLVRRRGASVGLRGGYVRGRREPGLQ